MKKKKIYLRNTTMGIRLHCKMKFHRKKKYNLRKEEEDDTNTKHNRKKIYLPYKKIGFKNQETKNKNPQIN